MATEMLLQLIATASVSDGQFVRDLDALVGCRTIGERTQGLLTALKNCAARNQTVFDAVQDPVKGRPILMDLIAGQRDQERVGTGIDVLVYEDKQC